MKSISMKNVGLPILLAFAAMGSAQSWSQLNSPAPDSMANPTLLTDGTVIMQGLYSSRWYKLTPDRFGSYQNGTWTRIASMPSNYAPTFYASAVLPDGRFFCLGGEYNFGLGPLWTNLGAIYDPVKDGWKAVTAPAAWKNIGDSACMTLPNGNLLISCAFTDDSTIFDPKTNSFSIPTVKGKADGNDEEGLCLLPNGNLLTVDAVNDGDSEIFNTTTMTWGFGGKTAGLVLVDPASEEIGPSILRPDGTVICFGGSAHNAIYNTFTSTWSAAPSLPNGNQCADAGAVLLPNGHVLVAASPGVFGNGLFFYEWNGTTFATVPVTATAATNTCFTVNFLMLPTGQALATQENGDVELYTGTGGPSPTWRPTLSVIPNALHIGFNYTVSGTQFSGMSGCSAYGDDQQNFTNYALARITNSTTGHVFFAKTSNPSTYKVQTGNLVETTHVLIPAQAELGPSTIQMVTNGIASNPVSVTIDPPSNAAAAATVIGISSGQNVSELWNNDNAFYTVNSVHDSYGQDTAVEVDYLAPGVSQGSFGVTVNAKAAAGVTGFVLAYDYVTRQWDSIGVGPVGATATNLVTTSSPDLSRYVDGTGHMRFVFKANRPASFTAAPFQLAINNFWLVFK